MTIPRLWRRLPALVLVALASACLTSQALKSLDDGSRDFLSKVRYIITRQERKSFLAIPAAERKAFIEDFWKNRDPTPETEVNEFKDQYFKRIADANHLFTEAAEPGWLQDRGRVYILLGPPTNRLTYPRGMTFYDVPREIWYYGFFPILFTDEAWNGNYKLDPLSVEQISILNRAQKEWQPRVADRKPQVDFEVEARDAGAGRAVIEITIPYRTIWFDSQGQVLKALFVVTLNLTELDGTTVQETRTERTLETTEEQLRSSFSKSHTLEIALEAPRGDYWLAVTVENGDSESKSRKTIRISL
jgi:GWxTD domain-containing protein